MRSDVATFLNDLALTGSPVQYEGVFAAVCEVRIQALYDALGERKPRGRK